MELAIRNMVCPRCISAVSDLLSSLGVTHSSVSLGKATIADDVPQSLLIEIASGLKKLGFELLTDDNSASVEALKAATIKLARLQGGKSANLSVALEQMLGTDYDTLSRLFSHAEGRTLERYYILQKIEYVKELLSYNELSVKEIAYSTGYSSTAHLSRQFRQVTGLSITEYKKTGAKRTPLTAI